MPNTTFCANIVCKTIADFLVTNGFVAWNHFGKQTADVLEKFTVVDNVYVFYDGADYGARAGHSIVVKIRISFLVVDYTVGTAANKDPYTIDNLRQYLAAGTQAWQEFGLPAVYPNLNVEPFMLENETVWRFEDGKSWTIFSGYITIHQTDLV